MRISEFLGSADLGASYLNDVQVTTGLPKPLRSRKRFTSSFSASTSLEIRDPRFKDQRETPSPSPQVRISSQWSRFWFPLWRSGSPKHLCKVKAFTLERCRLSEREPWDEGKRAQAQMPVLVAPGMSPQKNQVPFPGAEKVPRERHVPNKIPQAFPFRVFMSYEP